MTPFDSYNFIQNVKHLLLKLRGVVTVTNNTLEVQYVTFFLYLLVQVSHAYTYPRHLA